jgi:CBS domain-containing membrane protein
MSRDVVAVEFGTPLQEAWQLLHLHKVTALPVIDRARRVIGMVTMLDFMRHAGLDSYASVKLTLRQFLQPILRSHSEKPEVVGQIMMRQTRTASEHMHIIELMPLLAEYGMRHIPIINAERRLVGVVSNSDLVAGLYRGRLTDSQEMG